MTVRDKLSTGAVSSALTPLSRLYGGAAFLRRARHDNGLMRVKRLPCPTVSIGNITTGGTGKTPMTIHIATLLKAAGLSPLIVSRGYKGSASKRGGIVSDGKHLLMDAGCSGDEPLLMAERLPGVPVAVGRDRYRIATEAIGRFAPDVVLLDDGFQHFQLARDIDIVLLDHARPLGNGRLLPAGPLREPPSAIRKADIIVFTRADQTAGFRPGGLERLISGKPCFAAFHVPVVTAWITGGRSIAGDDRPLPETNALARRRAFVFCGLADNPAFIESVGRLGVKITGHRFFRDHHACTDAELNAVSREAKRNNTDIIITSAKDHVKFRDRPTPTLPGDLVVLDAAISFREQSEQFKNLLLEKIERSREPLNPLEP
ncbi:MAG: tetraacyldisaccharide 4'-kinase [Thermodesulfobacteriota bacterium]